MLKVHKSDLFSPFSTRGTILVVLVMLITNCRKTNCPK